MAWAIQWVAVGLVVLAIHQGFVAAVMVSGDSMLPNLRNGDIVVAVKQRDYTVGDVAVFRIPEGVGQGQSVIHRIVDGSSQQGWTFQGDNRDLADPWLVRDRDIVGTPRAVVPGGTRWLRLAAERAPYVIAGLLTLITLVVTFPTRRGGDEAAATPTDAPPTGPGTEIDLGIDLGADPDPSGDTGTPLGPADDSAPAVPSAPRHRRRRP